MTSAEVEAMMARAQAKRSTKTITCPVCGAMEDHYMAGTSYICGDRVLSAEESADLDEALREESE